MKSCCASVRNSCSRRGSPEVAPPVDGVSTAIDDAASSSRDAQRARRLGFGAKLCIHPRQVALVDRSFARATEIAWARRVLEAAAKAGGAAVAVDGKMVDRPVILRAQALLQHSRCAAMNAASTTHPPEPLQDFWNERYATDEFVYGTEPNQFLVEHAALIAPRGEVLCLADGEGRNSVWLARQGLQVMAVDVAERGVRKAAALAREAGVTLQTAVADVTRFDVGHSRWDAIVSIFLHLPSKARRALHRRCVDALKPGAVFIFEAYGPEQLRLRTGGPPDAKLLPALDDVLQDFIGCSIEHRFAGVRSVHEGRLHSGDGYVVQVIARRPA